jgi:hypothetical protein
MPKYINGPTNFAHLSGSINGINKEIYLFFDSHLDLNNQTRCESFDSIDISQHLYKLIKNAQSPLDFFLEVREEEIEKPTTNKRDIYIKEVMEMFKSEFIFEKDKVKYSKSNENVRLHYLDIRDHFDLFYIIDIIKYDIPETFDLLFKNIGTKEENITKLLEHINNVKFLLKKLNKNKNHIIQHPSKKYEKKDGQIYYFNKVINKYDSVDLQDNIFEFLEEHFTHYYNIIIISINHICEYLEEYDKNDLTKIKENLQIIYDSSIDIYSLFVDVYLLRRILDKNYVTNCIVYCGSQHCANYIYFLLKYCNFKLNNIQKSIEKDLDKLVDSIKNAEYAIHIYKLFYLKEKKYAQCIPKYEPLTYEQRGGNIEDLCIDFDKVYYMLK